MSTVKRFLHRTANGGAYGPIFRAMKVTDDNHTTIQGFCNRGKEKNAIFEGRIRRNKSRVTEYEIVKIKDKNGRIKQAKNGDYIVRMSDGSFSIVSGFLFESTTKETHTRINEPWENDV